MIVMNGIYLEIPCDISAATGSPRLPLDVEVKRRLVAAMYADEVIGGSSSCMLANLDKEELHHWLGGASSIPPLGYDDYVLEHRNLDESNWIATAESPRHQRR